MAVSNHGSPVALNVTYSGHFSLNPRGVQARRASGGAAVGATNDERASERASKVEVLNQRTSERARELESKEGGGRERGKEGRRKTKFDTIASLPP